MKALCPSLLATLLSPTCQSAKFQGKPETHSDPSIQACSYYSSLDSGFTYKYSREMEAAEQCAGQQQESGPEPDLKIASPSLRRIATYCIMLVTA